MAGPEPPTADSSPAVAFGWCGTSTPGLRPGSGSIPMTTWSAEVLRGVRDEAVLPDYDDEVVRGEQEPGQVDPFDQAPPPVRRDRGGDGGERRCHRFVPVLQVLDPRPRVRR